MMTIGSVPEIGFSGIRNQLKNKWTIYIWLFFIYILPKKKIWQKMNKSLILVPKKCSLKNLHNFEKSSKCRSENLVSSLHFQNPKPRILGYIPNSSLLGSETPGPRMYFKFTLFSPGRKENGRHFFTCRCSINK